MSLVLRVTSGNHGIGVVTTTRFTALPLSAKQGPHMLTSRERGVVWAGTHWRSAAGESDALAERCKPPVGGDDLNPSVATHGDKARHGVAVVAPPRCVTHCQQPPAPNVVEAPGCAFRTTSSRLLGCAWRFIRRRPQLAGLSRASRRREPEGCRRGRSDRWDRRQAIIILRLHAVSPVSGRRGLSGVTCCLDLRCGNVGSLSSDATCFQVTTLVRQVECSLGLAAPRSYRPEARCASRAVFNSPG